MLEYLNSTIYGNFTIKDLLISIVTLFLAIVIAKIITVNLKRALKEKMAKEHLEILGKIVYYGIILIAVISVLHKLGITMTGLLVAGGVVGIAIGFAAKSVIGNFISGIFLMIERPIKIGDQVNIDNYSGFVEDIHILSTIIRTYDGLYVRIPNETVFTSAITNYVAHVARRFEYVIGIRYQDDAEKAIEIINKILDMHPFVLKNPAPQIFVENLGDSSVNIVVRIWAPTKVWYSVKTELLWKIKKELEANGIEIPFPQRVVWFANELKTKNKRKS
ncbi:MAG TPA: mechanosensitive ion channel family protein [Nanoarchaeota archaeon]|nr:mechanosensitive ion channel family protein [Nanoarchaeota archaeon]